MKPVEKRVANFTIPQPVEPTDEYIFYHDLGSEVIVQLRDEDRMDMIEDPSFTMGNGYIKFDFKGKLKKNRNYVAIVIG